MGDIEVPRRWKVTEWRCACHGYRFVPGPRDPRWHVLNGRIRVPGVPFADADEIRRAHPSLIPANVDDVAALLAELDAQIAAHAQTVDRLVADGWNRVGDEMEREASAR